MFNLVTAKNVRVEALGSAGFPWSYAALHCRRLKAKQIRIVLSNDEWVCCTLARISICTTRKAYVCKKCWITFFKKLSMGHVKWNLHADANNFKKSFGPKLKIISASKDSKLQSVAQQLVKWIREYLTKVALTNFCKCCTSKPGAFLIFAGQKFIDILSLAMRCSDLCVL